MESFPNFYFLEVFDLMLTLKLLLLKHGFLSPSSSHVNYNNSLGSILSSWSYDHEHTCEVCWHLKSRQQGIRRSWVVMISTEIFSLKFWNFSLRFPELFPPHKQTLSTNQNNFRFASWEILEFTIESKWLSLWSSRKHSGIHLTEKTDVSNSSG